MTFGGQTITFVTITPGAKDRLGVPAKVETPVDVGGCLFRPMRVDEKVTLTDLATEMWKCTAPGVPAVLGMKANGQLKYLDQTYEIIGAPQPFTDFTSRVFKVTIICKRQVG